MAAPNPNPDEIDLSDEDFYNDSNDYEVAEDLGMAAAMGFTSFGGTRPADDDGDDDSRPSKKRRFNPNADNAFVSINEPDVIMAHAAQTSRGKAKGKAKPSSATKPKPKPKPAAKAKPKDKITYSDSEDDKKPKKAGRDDDDDFVLDTTAVAEEDDPNDPGLGLDWDGVTTRSKASTPAAGSRASTPGPQAATPPTGTGTGNAPAAGAGKGGGRGGRGGARGGAAAPTGKQTNPLWYVDYYDSSSNENPWEGMEKFKKLEPVGTWIAKFWDRNPAAGGAGGGGAAAGEGAAKGGAETVAAGVV